MYKRQLYLIVDTILVMLYCAIWIICFKKNSVFRALALSIIDVYKRQGGIVVTVDEGRLDMHIKKGA